MIQITFLTGQKENFFDDVTDDEIIIALTMDEDGNTKMEILT